MLTYQPPVIRISDLNRATQDVYETLKRLANHKLICKASFDTLVTKSGYSCRTVQRALRELQHWRYLQVEHYFDKRGRTLENGYRFTVTRVDENRPSLVGHS